jgi:alpha-L-fucosidase
MLTCGGFAVSKRMDSCPLSSNVFVLLGNWLSVNGEAIYSTRPWMVCQNETISSVFYTTKQVQNKGTNETLLYAIFTKWPTNNILQLRCVVPTSTTKISFLGLHDTELSAEVSVPYHPIANALDYDKEARTETSKTKQRRDERNSGIEVVLPALTPDKIPCQHAWVIALSHVDNV